MTENYALPEISAETCFVPQTHKGKGRRITVKPGETAARFLHYGRIILGAGDDSVKFNNNDHETGLICLKGKAKVSAEGKSFDFSQYDSIYIPRDSNIEVKATGAEGCDFAEVSVPVENKYPVQFVSFADVRKNPKLHTIAGKPPFERDLNVLLGANVEAGRIMAGVTFSADGNWTSFPPHEHAAMLEEAYLYIDMPAPQWGIQMVYSDLNEPELLRVVREGDVVLMPKGYHPNVASPGSHINFMWMMAANRERVDRRFGVVNVQPEYAAQGSGLEAAKDK